MQEPEPKGFAKALPTCDRRLLAELVSGVVDGPEFLRRVVELAVLQAHAQAGVLALPDVSAASLTLVASYGLEGSAPRTWRQAAGTGFLGRVARTGAILQGRSEVASARSAFDPSLGTAAFRVVLAAPVDRTSRGHGVLAVYRAENQSFTAVERQRFREWVPVADACLAFAAAIGARGGGRPGTRPAARISGMYRGQAVSPGYAYGKARVLHRAPVASILDHRRLHHAGAGFDSVLTLEELLARTIEQFELSQRSLGERLPEAASLLFESHLMMLQDEFFVGRVRDELREGHGLGRAVAEAATAFIKIFEASEHDYVREKARDIEDLALRLLDNLMPATETALDDADAHIVVARELLPSDILRIAQRRAQGIILTSGGVTAHISLLVRSLGIPMVIVTSSELLRVEDGTRLLVDGDGGTILVEPHNDAVRSFEKRNALACQAAAERSTMRDHTLTRDGCHIRLMANINLLSEIDHALELKAEGIGLYRTELLYLMRQELPSEEDQQQLYTRLLQRMADRPVVFRTLDAGGDKVLAYYNNAGEANPALGLRSTRFTLKYPEIFDRQLRAILRAAGDRDDVGILFPMIGSIDEWRQACRRFGVCASQISQEMGTPARVRLGVMVELPAVVDLAAEFAAEAAFFSIGTNDFIQYMLGVDRTNEHVAHYYCPHHPSVLRGLKRVVDSALRAGIEVSVCGEMAHDSRYIPFFVGIGVRVLSVDPSYLPLVQRVVGSQTVAEAEAYAQDLLAQSTIEAVESRLARVQL